MPDAVIKTASLPLEAGGQDPRCSQKKELLFPMKGNKNPVFKSLSQINDLHFRSPDAVG